MVSGSCLCQAVKYEIHGRISPIGLCHCSKCRKSSGAAFHSGGLCRTSRFRWVCGEESVSSYRSPSGYETRFCRHCGSPVPVVGVGPASEFVSVPMGTLDQDPGSRPVHHIFAGSKAPWFEIADELPQFDEHAPRLEGS